MSGYAFPVTYDVSTSKSEQVVQEIRLASDWLDSPWDFTAGIFAMKYESDGVYEVHGNTIAHRVNLLFHGLGVFGPVLAGVPNGTAVSSSWCKIVGLLLP